jgi:hypothetical protein
MAEELKPGSKPEAPVETRQRVSVLAVIDVLAKLTAASALVLGAIIANSYQAKLTGTTILSQREQSETQLRASMFSSLIGPIIGAQKGDSTPADREQLLVELLLLNFHEHFELKPLMLHADSRLAAKNVAGMTLQQAQNAREELRSITRRVAAQQIADLIRGSDPSQAQTQGCRIYLVSLNVGPAENSRGGKCQLFKSFEDVVRVESPDKKYTLSMVASNPDWVNETFNVSVSLTTNTKDEEQNYQDLTYNFVLSWFDLPLTDNTLLPDGNRFAFTLAAVMKEREATLRIIWFPKDYVTPRERPLDSRRYLQLVGK